MSVVLTVRNDPAGCAVTLSSLARQIRAADEVIVVDGGSIGQHPVPTGCAGGPRPVRTGWAGDDTAATIDRFAEGNPRIRRIAAPGANIAAGRNIGIRQARGEIIATIDAACRAEPDWLARLVAPFEAGPANETPPSASLAGEHRVAPPTHAHPTGRSVNWAAGFYRIEPQSLLEEVVGLATMRGQLAPANPETFNPSARSMAFSRDAWSLAGGFPEWLRFSEDTLFDHKLRAAGIRPVFVPDAVVHWRPRTSLRSIARQFFSYGTGRGQTRIGAGDVLYNLRNLGLALAGGLACFWHWAAVVPLAGLVAYFYIWAFHGLAAAVARRTARTAAYPLCLVVVWVVMLANTAGFVVGSMQRLLRPRVYRDRLRDYLAPEPRHSCRVGEARREWAAIS